MAAHLLVGAGTTRSSISASAESAFPPVSVTAAVTVTPCPSDIDMLAEVTSPLTAPEAATAPAALRHDQSSKASLVITQFNYETCRALKFHKQLKMFTSSQLMKCRFNMTSIDKCLLCTTGSAYAN